jgi:hypothetical protein
VRFPRSIMFMFDHNLSAFCLLFCLPAGPEKCVRFPRSVVFMFDQPFTNLMI